MILSVRSFLPQMTTGKFQKAATAASSVAQMVSKAGGGGGDSPSLGLGRDILEAVSADVKLDEDRSPGSTPTAAAATLDGGPDPGRTTPTPSRTGTAAAKDPLGSSLFSMAALMRPSVTASGAAKGPGSSAAAVASVTSSLSPDLGHPGLLPPPHPGLSASALLANLNSSLQLGQVFLALGGFDNHFS